MKYEHQIQFRLGQVWALARLALAGIAAAAVALADLCARRKNEPIWLIADRGSVAGDNGYKFFLHLRRQHPELRTYFILSRSVPEWEQLAEYGDARLEFRSLRHYFYLWRATYLVSTHIQGYFPYVGLGLWFRSICPIYAHKRHIFLQHGVSKDYTPFLEYSNTHADLVMCAVEPERDFFVRRYHYPQERVVLTGMCRYDQLVDESADRRQILLVPTWREYIYKDSGFEQTNYYRSYASLLSSPRLAALLEQHDWRLVFYPHHEMQRYIASFEGLRLSERIHIAREEECDLSVHFRRSAVMITDYSSVYFDFAYMQKPVLLYQFDREEFQRGHYEQGWLDYDHCFGPVCPTEDRLLAELETLLTNGLHPAEEYRQYARDLFPMRDRENSERCYRAIIDMEERRCVE